MKIIVTHMSPDLDAIFAAWLVQKFLPGWNEARFKFVPAGERLKGFNDTSKIIERNEEEDVIHVDTGLGPLDHHQTNSTTVSAASVTWDYVSKEHVKASPEIVKNDRWYVKKEAIERMVKVVVDIDHFQEIFWENPSADYYDFGLVNVIEGLKTEKPNKDIYYLQFGFEAIEALLHEFENKVWAEHEIKKKGIEFETKFGKGIGVETLNDDVVKLGQKMGYKVVIRKDPRKGYVRIKTWPNKSDGTLNNEINLTKAYEKLKDLDKEATWYLHISKKMLLNGTSKSPKTKPSKLALSDIIEAVKNSI